MIFLRVINRAKNYQNAMFTVTLVYCNQTKYKFNIYIKIMKTAHLEILPSSKLFL